MRYVYRSKWIREKDFLGYDESGVEIGLTLSAIAVLGEFVTDDGFDAGDHFLLVIFECGECLALSVDLDNRELTEAILHYCRLGHLRLSDEVGNLSVVLWPDAISGEELLFFVDEEKYLGIFQRLNGMGTVRIGLTREVRDYLDRSGISVEGV